MSITGGPSFPTSQPLSAQAINNGASQSLGKFDCAGFDVMHIEVISNQAVSLTVRGTAADDAAATMPEIGDRLGGGVVTYTGLAVAAGASGLGYQLWCKGLRWIEPYVINGSGAVATVTARVSLH